MRTAKACNAEEFIKFLKEVNKMCPKMTIILDNASYHKAKIVRKFVDDANGGIELIFLPAYTPQLNPIEIQWRVLKRLLHGRYFASIEELEAAITSLGRQRPDASGQDYEVRDTRLNLPADAGTAMIHRPPMARFS